MADFERGIERLIGNWGEKAISPGLIRELKNRYFIRDARLWDKMITLVLDRCKYSPKMVNFREAMESMKNEVSRNSNHALDRWCGNCMKGFLEKYILSRGMPYTIMVPCSCHPCPPTYENEYIGERITISKEDYDERWAEIRAERAKPKTVKNLTNEALFPKCGDNEEREAIQAVAAIEKKESTPPDNW